MARPILSDQDYQNIARILNLPDPTLPQHAATKAYVDSAIEGLAWKDSVRVASVANVTVSGPGTSIDGVTLTANDRVLLKDQTAPAENGIYVFNGSGTPMTRAADMSTAAEVEQAIASVEEGTANAGATFRQTAVNVTLGTTALAWVSFGTVAPAATESLAGIAEIANQSEADGGTDDQRFLTALKAKSASWMSRGFSQVIGDGSATSFNIDHNFGTRNVLVEIVKNSGNYDTVIADVTRPSTNRVTVAFASAPASNAYLVLISKLAG